MQRRSLRTMGRAACAALALVALNALAHSTSTAYLETGASASGEPTIQWRIALRDLDALLDLDANADSQLSWGEVIDRAADVSALADSNLTLRRGTARCTLRFLPMQYVRLADTGYAQLGGAATCDPDGVLTLDYRLFENIDPSHRVLISTQGSAAPQIAAPGASINLSTPTSPADTPNGFLAFLWSGIAHISGGFDHVLFLLCLLLPAVLQRRAGQWVARDNVRGALVAVIWIATAFTMAHSITLALATFGVIRIPARVIEPLIALTIVATALNNIWPIFTRRLALVAFAFGLIHGFGFAEVLAPLSLPRSDLAAALLGFNLGVELGQLAIVASAFFVLSTLRRWTGYSRWVLEVGSAMIAVIGTLWFIERVAGVSILGV